MLAELKIIIVPFLSVYWPTLLGYSGQKSMSLYICKYNLSLNLTTTVLMVHI